MSLTIAPDLQGIPISSEFSDDMNLVCPACHGDYSHIREVHTEISGAPPALNEGIDPYPGTIASGVTPLRRPCLVITFDGECEHAWELRIQQHKGVNYVSTRLLEKRTPDEL